MGGAPRPREAALSLAAIMIVLANLGRHRSAGGLLCFRQLTGLGVGSLRQLLEVTWDAITGRVA
jgi:hypothetical protein